MKQFQLLSILILLFSFLGVQCAVGQIEKNGVQYLIYDESEYDLGYNINSSHLEQSIANYPAQAYFEAKRQSGAITDFRITFQCYVNSWENAKTITAGDNKYDSSKWFDIPSNTTKIRIYRHEGSLRRWVKNIYVRIAPHTKLNTSSLTFNTSVTNTSGDEQTVDFYSFLTKTSLTATIVNAKDANGNSIDLGDQITLKYGDIEAKELGVGANVLEKIDENNCSFKFVFRPKNIMTNVTCSIKIYNPGASIGETLYIPVTLNSSLATPDGLKCDASGYTFAKLSWNAVSGANSYNLYDNGTKIGNYSTTSATITALSYGSSHSYTVTSVVGSAESDPSSPVAVTTPAYPQIQNITFPDVQQNQVTVNWSPVNITPNGHSVARYHIHLYQPSTAGTFIKAVTTTGTSYTLTDLIDNTEYTVYIDVEYQYTLNGNTITDTDWFWSNASFTTTSFIPSDPFDGVLMYQGTWYRVNLNNDIDISSNTAATDKEKVYTMSLDYPCEPKVDFQINTTAFGIIYGTANIKIDESKTGKWDDTNRIHADSYSGENKAGTTNTSGHDVKALQFYCDGGGNSNEYVHDIGLKITPHILLQKTKYITIDEEKAIPTQTTEALLDFGDIEINQSKTVTIDFKSFLSKGNITARLTDDTDSDIFWLNSVRGTKEHNIASDNEIAEIYTDNGNFKISFNPTKANDEAYKGKLIIKDDQHTVILHLQGKGIKRTPEISWINDKYIGLGEYIAGAATSTCGIVKYKSDKPDIISIVDGDLLYAKTIGSSSAENTVSITAFIEEDETHYGIEKTETFIVTDKIIQTIKWEDDLSTLTENSELNLTAKAITRTTGEPNGNEIIYSSSDANIIDIIEGKPVITGTGFAYITAHQIGNDEYAPTYMTKLAFISKTTNDCEDLLALKHQGASFGDWTQGFNWGPYTLLSDNSETTIPLATIGDDITFETTKTWNLLGTLDTSGDQIIVSDDLGNVIYTSTLADKENETKYHKIENKIDKDARALTFTLKGNFTIKISNIKVTPAKYINITPDRNEIEFQGTEVDFKAIEEVDFDWANQPDYIWAKIIDDTDGVFAVDTKTTIFGSPTCGAYGTSTVKVIFSPKEETEYKAKLAIYVGGNTTTPVKTIDIIGQGYKAQQKIYWLDVSEVTTADKEINLAHTSASAQQPITYTIVSEDGNVVKINENSTLTIVGEGKFTLKAQQEGNNSYHPTEITEEKEFTATIGNLIFDNKEKNKEWTTTRNWKPDSRLNLKRNVSPSAIVNAVIQAEAVISNAERNEINNLTFEDGGKLTINPTSALKANAVSNATATNLTLKASAEGNATFIYNGGSPSATVEMYSKATGGEKNKIPQWQYMGVAVSGATTSNFPNSWILEWDEVQNPTGDPWSDAPLAAGTTLAPWAGYSISQPQAATYTTQGALLHGDKKYDLSYTPSTDPDCGFNLLTNSYTAPIDITKLTTGDFAGADACIILYNTGTYANWESQQGSSGQNPGQLTVIPVASAESTGLPTTIPSMQAFFVKANAAGATFTVNYDTVVAGATYTGNQMRARQARNEFNVLKIMIEGENSRDRLFLLEKEETSKAYDNGYEARKIFDAPRGHQMYATCQYGYASIDCSESFVGQAIGLKGDNEGEQLTISFDTDRLYNYESLYLYDKATGKYVNIVAGEKYTFFGIKGADDNRFTIVTNPDDKNQTPPFVVIGEELAFDKSQINADNANIYIYDTSGRLLIIDKVNPYENYNIPNMPKGVYLISINGYTTKIVKK